MSIDANAIEALTALADGAASAERLEPGGYYVVTSRDGHLHQVDLTGDDWSDVPKRKRGWTGVRDVVSFAEYWRKHAEAGTSEIYADRDYRKVVAVLDAHGSTVPGWREHGVSLVCKYSEAFKAWLDRDGKPMDQETFAEFLEDNRADIAEPSAAEMLEVAQSIQASTKVEFQSAHALPSGQKKLSYVETTTASAGAKGSLTIPAQLTLRLPVFEGATVADELVARFRYRINGGKLSLHYKLDRPADVVSSAFEGVIHDVEQACSAVVLRGTPA